MRCCLVFVSFVMLKYSLVSGQVSPGFNLARLLQARTNRLQQMMLQSLQNQGTPFTSPTGGTSPGSGGTTGTSELIPIDQLLQRQRNLQSQLLQNVRNFQQALQSSQATQTQAGNTLLNQQTNTGSNNAVVVDNIRRNGRTETISPVQTTPAPTQVGDTSSMFAPGLTGNSSFGGLFNTLGFGFPSTSGSFWTQGLQTNNGQTGVGGDSSSGMTPTASSTFGTGANSPDTFSSLFGQTSGTPSISGSSVGPVSGSSGSSGTPFSSTSGGSGTDFSTFGQESGIPGFSLSNDLSSTFTSVFNNDFTTGPGSTFLPGTGNDAGSTGSGFTSVLNTGSTVQSTAPITEPALQCTEEYRNMPGHTLCLTDSQLVTNSGITPEDRLGIVEGHNRLRAAVQPPAEDLMKLQWDERLASVADKWARQCTLAHDKERRIPELGMTIGQNVAVGYEDWQQAIQQWYNEIRYYRYGLDPDSYLGPDGWRQVAHFTQIVQNGTYLIGCGFAVCPSTEYIRFFVCNYASGQSDLATPYTAGTQCGQCVNNCVNGLCDCGNLVCINKGRLNPGTCTCECPKPYKGRQCEILDCPPEDNWICGRDWPASFCDKFYNVPEECPIMCGLCPGPPIAPEIRKVPNTTFVSDYGCRYRGARDSIETCKSYGDNGADMKMCATEGGSVGCAECDRYFNIKKDYCPVMCGLCDAPCGGKRCYNGGTLDTRTCRCQCRRPFTGDICDYAQCPVKGDPTFCRFWPPRYCRQYFNVPEECPYMCGICKTDTAIPNSGSTGSGSPNMRTAEGNEAS